MGRERAIASLDAPRRDARHANAVAALMVYLALQLMFALIVALDYEASVGAALMGPIIGGDPDGLGNPDR